MQSENHLTKIASTNLSRYARLSLSFLFLWNLKFVFFLVCLSPSGSDLSYSFLSCSFLCKLDAISCSYFDDAWATASFKLSCSEDRAILRNSLSRRFCINLQIAKLSFMDLFAFWTSAFSFRVVLFKDSSKVRTLPA